MDSIRQILDPQVLTTAYVERPTGRPTPLTDFFYVSPEQIEGDNYRLFVDPAENEPAPMNNPGSEARVLQASGATERVATLFSAFNKLPMQGTVLTALREPNSSALQEMGRAEIKRQQMKFAARHRLMKEVTISKILTDGVVYMNADGVVLETSSGAAVTADFNVAAGHKSQLDYDGSGDLIGTAWDVAGADIQENLDAIDDAAEVENVPPPTDIWVHSSWKSKLRNNTDFQTWAAASAADSEQILRGNMIPGLFGKTWHFYSGTYTASDGTTLPFIDPAKAVLTPPPTEPWLKASVGSTLTPRSIGVTQNWEQALTQSEKVYGEFSYAKLIDDPWTLFMYMGDTFGLHFADPNAIWMPTIDF